MPEPDDTSTYEVAPIGVVTSTRTEAVDDDWDAVETTITLLAPFGPEAIAELDAFSHLEVVYLFHLVDADTVHTGARVPRGNPDWPAVGIFAQRAKNRPNRLGMSTCELLGIEGTTLRVRGLDAIDGTPILDIKPYMQEFAPRTAVRQPAWSKELMAGYW
jgi:tRNA-Thr(GGU) m(6)t(6)A37 methyltransferase TsaA